MEPFSDQIVMFMLVASVEDEQAVEHQDRGQQMSVLGESVRASFPHPRQYCTRRVLKDLSEFDVIQNNRLSACEMYSLYDLLEADLDPQARTNHAVIGFQKLLATLHFLASGTFQPTLSQTCVFSQPTLSRCITQVIKAFRKLTTQFIRFPDTDSGWHEIKLGFYNEFQFPNILGAIDCSHVHIRPPQNSEESFQNQKCFHSMNIQAVCDADMKFTNLFVGFPGSSHDSFILNQSSLFQDFETGNMLGGCLLGDAGYPKKPWLLTPLSTTVAEAQEGYQDTHIASLGVCGIVNACCILHNICVANRLPVTLRRRAFRNENHSSAPSVGMDEGDEARRILIETYLSSACPME
ncbi:putative nuclease HARBI1 [Pseudophryne corroboree]|uniref:putative nuclease HARBI1 n=1 Tax=Pseudophryne corroboree TaxID=495146 RepID=UPI003081EA81